MSKTKILLMQIAGCIAFGTTLGVSFWWFDGGKTCKKALKCVVAHPIENEKGIKVYQGRWHKTYLELEK